MKLQPNYVPQTFKRFLFPTMFLVFGGGAILGIFIGRYVLHGHGDNFNCTETREVRNWRFVSPLFECEASEKLREGLVPFGYKMQRLVQTQMRLGAVQDTAVYYRDLRNGPWSGVNERARFIPSSLLKVPLMMSYYSMAEKDPSVLGWKFTLEKKIPDPPNTVQAISPSKEIEVGKEYSTEELIRRIIVYSDNQAATLLYRRVNYHVLSEVFERLGVPDLSNSLIENTLSVKEYAAFFRILYNASFLTDTMSEKALKLLGETEFNDGIVAGVPPDIRVSHKFGEAGSFGAEGRQLHDCGVIYHPLRPYLLCVMTKGENVASLTKSIKEISELVYQSVDEQVAE